MNKFFTAAILAAVLAAGAGACAKPVYISDEVLHTYSSKQLLETAAQRYVNGDYAGAKYYYNKIIEFYPEDPEYVSWANYEIGYIFYVEHKYQQANEYFDKTIQIETVSHAPQILAANMKKLIVEEHERHARH